MGGEAVGGGILPDSEKVSVAAVNALYYLHQGYDSQIVKFGSRYLGQQTKITCLRCNFQYNKVILRTDQGAVYQLQRMTHEASALWNAFYS